MNAAAAIALLVAAQDALLPRHSAALQAALSALPRLGAAIALLRSWARRQGFSAAPDGVTGFHLAMLAVHLQQLGNLVSHWACVPPLLINILILCLCLTYICMVCT